MGGTMYQFVAVRIEELESLVRIPVKIIAFIYTLIPLGKLWIYLFRPAIMIVCLGV